MAGLQGLPAMGALYCLGVGWSQWRPLDISGTHLPYCMMQLLSLFKTFRKVLLWFVVVCKKHWVIMAGYTTRKYPFSLKGKALKILRSVRCGGLVVQNQKFLKLSVRLNWKL